MLSGRPLVNPGALSLSWRYSRGPRWRDLANPHMGAPSTCGAGALHGHGTPAVYARCRRLSSLSYATSPVGVAYGC
jgi:hypothetical protein